jgi:hypothetical protein
MISMDDKTQPGLVVSETAVDLGNLATRLAAASKRYAEDGLRIDKTGPEQHALIWELEASLGDLAEEIHNVRRRLRKVRRGATP